jgi:hypothetical protein
MWLHAAAFIMYEISVLMTLSAYAEFLINEVTYKLHSNGHKEAPTALWFAITVSIRVVMSTIAQLLLTSIFWDLAAKPTQEEQQALATETDEHFDTVEVEDFDEDAEIQARIWNRFIRDVRGLDDSERTDVKVNLLSDSEVQPHRRSDVVQPTSPLSSLLKRSGSGSEFKRQYGSEVQITVKELLRVNRHGQTLLHNSSLRISATSPKSGTLVVMSSTENLRNSDINSGTRGSGSIKIDSQESS